eukprot:Pgem_evm1s7623
MRSKLRQFRKILRFNIYLESLSSSSHFSTRVNVNDGDDIVGEFTVIRKYGKYGKYGKYPRKTSGFLKFQNRKDLKLVKEIDNEFKVSYKNNK